MAGERGEEVLLFIVTNEPAYLTFKDFAVLSRVNHAVKEKAHARLTRVSPYQTYYRLLHACLTVPTGTRHFEESHQSNIVKAVQGGLQQWTPQHWAVYYAFWYQKAVQSACRRTVHVCADGGLESKVSLLLSSDGLLKQLPNEFGTLSVLHEEQVYVMTVAHCHQETARSSYVVVPGGQACDWNLFLSLMKPMARVAWTHDAPPAAVKAQQVVTHLLEADMV